MKAVFTIGISASGKSTWAKQQKESVVLSRDDIRRSILEHKLGRNLVPGELWKLWKFKDEGQVTEIVEQLVTSLVKANTNIIFADTNLNRGRLNQAKAKMESLGYFTEEKFFPIDLEEAFKRDAGRPDGVGESVIFKQWLQYHEMVGSRKYKPVPGARKAIQVDIDGTIAVMKDRGPFDWEKVGNDELNKHVYTAVRGFYQQGYEVIFLSGRDEVCRPETEAWLVKYNIPYTELFMRPANDIRKDSIIKEEMFWEHVADKYNIEVVFDDRPQVVSTWIRLGLNVFAVGNPYIRF